MSHTHSVLSREQVCHKVFDRQAGGYARDFHFLAVAIKGSTAEVAEVIYANMSARSKEATQTDVEYLHNVRMRDVEEAQQRIVAIIRRLEDEGALTISKGGSDEIIA